MNNLDLIQIFNQHLCMKNSNVDLHTRLRMEHISTNELCASTGIAMLFNLFVGNQTFLFILQVLYMYQVNCTYHETFLLCRLYFCYCLLFNESIQIFRGLRA